MGTVDCAIIKGVFFIFLLQEFGRTGHYSDWGPFFSTFGISFLAACHHDTKGRQTHRKSLPRLIGRVE